MRAADYALAYAAKRIGYYAPADPLPGSEAGRWMAEKTGEPWLAGPSWSIWWCMCYASMCVYEAGGQLPGGPSYNCQYTVNAARREGRLVDKSDTQPGDLAMFDWDGGRVDHVGIIERVYSWGVQTIEGNTSPGTRGSQRAGNGTYRRTRSWVDVKYVVRPYYPQDNGTRPASRSDKPAKLDVDGWWGSDTTRGLQYINRHKPDGVVSSQPVSNKRFFTAATTGWEWVPDAQAEGSQIIATLQRAFKVDPDGFAGGDTAEGMRGYYGLPAGRVVDRDTVRAMQRAINRQLGY